MKVKLYNRFLHRLNSNIINNIIKSMGVAVVQWAGHGSFKREVPCSIQANHGAEGIRPQMPWCHISMQVRSPVLILEMKNQVTPKFFTEYDRVSRL